MVLGGLIMFWFVYMNCVYECVVMMCLFGGFCRRVIFSKIMEVQSSVGICISRWLQVSKIGLIVAMSAYSIFGGEWC